MSWFEDLFRGKSKGPDPKEEHKKFVAFIKRYRAVLPQDLPEDKTIQCRIIKHSKNSPFTGYPRKLIVDLANDGDTFVLTAEMNGSGTVRVLLKKEGRYKTMDGSVALEKAEEILFEETQEGLEKLYGADEKRKFSRQKSKVVTADQPLPPGQ